MNTTVKNILNPGAYSNPINIVLLILRLSVGVLMLTHGWGKFVTLFGAAPIQFADPLGVGAAASLSLTVFAEVLCSILLIIGLGSRLATIPLIITMFVAIFIIHESDGFGRQELPLLYATIYIAIALLGAGKYSVDYLITKKK
ncbi:DoxX family protein [Gelidibacter salicanalis]|uniref:DoxX family protein n=1 Tax=Gelidibacter salicanalis TaxID=291193 RepID=A0A5C7AS08_9FLAO|nr:DoxX family protein [Gelidibacter salicanalis]TXE10343.1 DoxX family protein [Gelidibacter salicanalis]